MSVQGLLEVYKCWENAANAGKMKSIDERTAINYSLSFKIIIAKLSS